RVRRHTARRTMANGTAHHAGLSLVRARVLRHLSWNDAALAARLGIWIGDARLRARARDISVVPLRSRQRRLDAVRHRTRRATLDTPGHCDRVRTDLADLVRKTFVHQRRLARQPTVP